ncbi:MAG: SGNH/GDSL hydrolase family protein [Verrucomicrobiota bacterium]|nr:SGNH/GDSL hydrolase family protein [Verrucomicrobiota bacterium]
MCRAAVQSVSGNFGRTITLGILMFLTVVMPETVSAQTNLVGEVRMTNPPSITPVGPMINPPQLPGRRLVRRSEPVFRYSGARVEQWDNTYPHDQFLLARGITGSFVQIPFHVEFETDAQEFEILTLGTKGSYRIKVDQEYVNLQPTDGPVDDGNFYWLRVSFDAKKSRLISFESIGMAFGGVEIGVTDSINAPHKPLGPRCIIMGDSFTEGLLSYAQRLSSLLNWEVWSSGVGGTGYLNSGLPGRSRFRDRVQSDVITNKPNIVVIAAGMNDAFYSPTLLKTEAQTLYDTILTNLPGVKLIVVGPWWPRGTVPLFVLQSRNAIREAALSRGLDFIDPLVATTSQEINLGWITGTGNAGTPQGDGNADEYISADTTHPTDLGHQYLALRLAEVLRPIQVIFPPTIEIHQLAGIYLQGRVGRSYVIQSRVSEEAAWVDGPTVTLSSSPQLWVDPSSTNRMRKAYRALLLP